MVGQDASLAHVKYALACLFVLVAACSNKEPRAPSAQQSSQLNEAENMLNAVAGNEEGPADRSAGPANSSD